MRHARRSRIKAPVCASYVNKRDEIHGGHAGALQAGRLSVRHTFLRKSKKFVESGGANLWQALTALSSRRLRMSLQSVASSPASGHPPDAGGEKAARHTLSMTPNGMPCPSSACTALVAAAAPSSVDMAHPM
mmetsp:Transcript_29285/g.61557  ORF Transcript_29285/g.61557 Transcript_29285/m.61557 type:complete len:132 (+) Transcript_29285:416-811(+)